MKKSWVASMLFSVHLVGGCANVTEKAFLAYHESIGREYKQYVIERKPVPEWTKQETDARVFNYYAAEAYARRIRKDTQ